MEQPDWSQCLRGVLVLPAGTPADTRTGCRGTPLLMSHETCMLVSMTNSSEHVPIMGSPSSLRPAARSDQALLLSPSPVSLSSSQQGRSQVFLRFDNLEHFRAADQPQGRAPGCDESCGQAGLGQLSPAMSGQGHAGHRTHGRHGLLGEASFFWKCLVSTRRELLVLPQRRMAHSGGGPLAALLCSPPEALSHFLLSYLSPAGLCCVQ